MNIKSIICCVVLSMAKMLYAQDWQMQSISMQTRWTEKISFEHTHPEYPRPQLMRNNWTNLNGLWEYAVTDSITNSPTYEGQILVPYPLESALSGVKRPL